MYVAPDPRPSGRSTHCVFTAPRTLGSRALPSGKTELCTLPPKALRLSFPSYVRKFQRPCMIQPIGEKATSLNLQLGHERASGPAESRRQYSQLVICTLHLVEQAFFCLSSEMCRLLAEMLYIFAISKAWIRRVVCPVLACEGSL